jgi:hypothetical protein
MISRTPYDRFLCFLTMDCHLYISLEFELDFYFGLDLFVNSFPPFLLDRGNMHPDSLERTEPDHLCNDSIIYDDDGWAEGFSEWYDGWMTDKGPDGHVVLRCTFLSDASASTSILLHLAVMDSLTDVCLVSTSQHLVMITMAAIAIQHVFKSCSMCPRSL